MKIICYDFEKNNIDNFFSSIKNIVLIIKKMLELKSLKISKYASILKKCDHFILCSFSSAIYDCELNIILGFFKNCRKHLII